MVAIFPVLFALFSAFAQSTYYVSPRGSDSTSCGGQSAPCATINQVLTNYPGASYTISVPAGTYATTPITLEKDAVVTLQGTGNPTIITSGWKSGVFLNQTQTSGFGFRDLTLTLEGSGTTFTILNSGVNTVGFYNVQLVYSTYTEGDFIELSGGSLVVSNVTVTGADFDGYFIVDESDGEDSSIIITGSTFANIEIGEYGGLLVFDAYGSANIILNSSTFTNITADYVFIGFWAEDSNQQISVTDVAFNNTYSYLPSVYIENDYQCIIYVNNSQWNNATADFVAGALETLGSDDGQDHNITLNGLTFTNSAGPYAGALLVAFNSLNLSDSTFANNSGEVANDVVQGLDSYSGSFGYNITNSTSTSDQPRAVVWNLSTGSIVDISDQLPDPSRSRTNFAPLTRAKLSASPKFGRKPRKN